MAENCDFYSITTDEILRDRLIFGIPDAKVRERLLRGSKLTLEKTDEICRVSESTASQMKEVSGGESVSAFESKTKARRQQHKKQDRNKLEEESNKPCGNCGRRHEPRQCFAQGRACNTCSKMGHFASVCRIGKLRKESRTRVKTIEQHEDIDSEESDVYVISDISAVTLDNSQLVTLKLVNSGSFLRFQPDTGAQCNVIPVPLYKQACNDEDISNVRRMKSTISAYGGLRLSVVGEVILKVSRDKTKCKLNCKLVDSEDIRPILGRKACLGMNIIRYTDNDALNKPQTGSFPIYAVKDNDKFLTKEKLCNQFPEVFSEGVGKLDGKYHIKINSQVSPIQHAPWRVPVAIRARLKEEPDGMTEQEIVAPVTALTPSVSSMVVVPKPNGKLRICLDPKELNKAIQRDTFLPEKMWPRAFMGQKPSLS